MLIYNCLECVVNVMHATCVNMKITQLFLEIPATFVRYYFNKEQRSIFNAIVLIKTVLTIK